MDSNSDRISDKYALSKEVYDPIIKIIKGAPPISELFNDAPIDTSESFLYDNRDFFPKTADEVRIEKLTTIINKWIKSKYK